MLYDLDRHPDAFERVRYAGEDAGRHDHRARILTGESGIQKIEHLMRSIGEGPEKK